MEKYIIQIPVKKESHRVPHKSVRGFAGTTLLDISILKALEVLAPEQIYLNTNCEEAISIANKYKISIFRRDEKLCQNKVTLDEFTYDFITKVPVESENIILVNPVCPLQQVEVLKNMLNHFESKAKISSLISGNKFKLHAFLEDRPINFEIGQAIPETQNIEPVVICNWAFAIWNSSNFKSHFESGSSAVFGGELEIFDSPLNDSIKISEEKDFSYAEEQFQSR